MADSTLHQLNNEQQGPFTVSTLQSVPDKNSYLEGFRERAPNTEPSYVLNQVEFRPYKSDVEKDFMQENRLCWRRRVSLLVYNDSV
jgi:hypothetical protein